MARENDSLHTDITDPEYWSERYDTRQTGWDMGEETPVFRALRERQEIPFGPQRAGRNTRLWIPGCGYGHDALALAEAGYDVTAVDFSDRPLHILAERARHRSLRVKCVQADVCALPPSLDGTFDLALEYTCYCAILPERRTEYVQALARSLCPGGWLVALFFPTDGREGGPPFAVDVSEAIALCTGAGLELRLQRIPAESHPARRNREVLMMFRKPVNQHSGTD